MVVSEKNIYKKIYRELYEVIDILSENEKDKISKELIDNIRQNMDNEYLFKIDKNKSLLEQNLLPQTQAMLIKLYEKYLCSEEEKEKWNLYDKMCYAKIKKMKVKKYTGYSNIEEMRNKETKALVLNENVKMTEIKKENFIKKIIKKIKRFFKIK